MKNLNWAVNENEYHLETPYGVATIIEEREDIGDKTAVGPRYSYTARFEGNDGTIKSSGPEYHFTSFREAEGWLLWGVVMDIDQPQEKELGTERLLASLKLSEKLLPDISIETHQRRIKGIKKFLRGNRRHSKQNIRALEKYSTDFHKYLEEFPQLNWQEQGNEYYVQLDQGRVVIKEIRNQDKWTIGRVSSYYPRIEHIQGMVFKGIEAFSFEAAEQWIKSKLFAISHPLPGDNELELEDLLKTLDVCIQVLPESTDPIHFLRLEWIKTRVEEMLL